MKRGAKKFRGYLKFIDGTINYAGQTDHTEPWQAMKALNDYLQENYPGWALSKKLV